MAIVRADLPKQRIVNVSVKSLENWQSRASVIVAYITRSNMEFELFEIYNDKNRRVFWTNSINCFPSKEHLDSMLKNGYKVKVNNKQLSKKAINELYKEVK